MWLKVHSNLNAIVKHIITRTRIPTAGVAFGRHRSVFLTSYHVRGVSGSCAGHLTTEFCTVVILLAFILIIISIPSPPHSFIPALKPSFSEDSSHRSLPFLLQD